MSTEKRKLLVIEDDPGLQRQLRWSFDGYEVLIAGDRDGALELLRREEPPVITLDLGLPPDTDGVSEGLATLEAIRSIAPQSRVIVVTGNEDRENAVRAVSLGAYDFYQKPIDAEVLGLIIDRAHHLYELEEENRRLARVGEDSPLRGVTTASPDMLKLCRTIEKVAPVDVCVLLAGESGTGKELLAKALHELGPRGRKRFVAINCAAIPETLLESELFGHEKGAFTGAIKQTRGKVELADGGTLLLDEIGDVPLGLQVKLLRFLQERSIERIGGRKEIPVDVRIVCATNQDLDELIKAGRFREDLYYRISEMVITIPPLRDRENDPALLARSFLHRLNKELGRSVRGFTGDALAALANHSWPGNVRELENRVKRAVIMAEGNRITAQDLELDAPDEEAPSPSLKEVRERAEREALQRALAQVDGNVSRAAKLLGVSRPTLYDLMRHHNFKW
ncbi:MAG: PEP-CTERM-box response regulator transcription factor [Alphaproteobacteria bacterium]